MVPQMGVSWELEGDKTEWGSLWGGAALTKSTGRTPRWPSPFQLGAVLWDETFLKL